MTALDTNVWIRFLRNDQDSQAREAARLMERREAVLLPMVLSELLTDPSLGQDAGAIASLPLLDIQPGYWMRAGQLRAALFRRGLRPKLIDTLIAQMCIDHDIPLLTADRDYRAFERHAGLRLA